MATVMKAEQFIDDAAKGGSEEEEWESQDEGTPVEEAEDGTGVALLPLVPLPGDHHLHAWMRPNLVRKAELALSVAEATRLAQLKPKDATRQDAMKAAAQRVGTWGPSSASTAAMSPALADCPAGSPISPSSTCHPYPHADPSSHPSIPYPS